MRFEDYWDGEPNYAPEPAPYYAPAPEPAPAPYWDGEPNYAYPEPAPYLDGEPNYAYPEPAPYYAPAPEPSPAPYYAPAPEPAFYWDGEPNYAYPEPAPEPAPYYAPAPEPAPFGIAALPITPAPAPAPAVPTYSLPDWVNQRPEWAAMNEDFSLIDSEGTNVSGSARFAPNWNVGFETLPGYDANQLQAYGGDTSGDNGGPPSVSSAALRDFLQNSGLQLRYANRPGEILRWIENNQGDVVHGAPVSTSTDDSQFWNMAMMAAGLLSGGAATAAGMSPAAAGAISGGTTGFGNTGTLQGALTGAATGAIGAGASSYLPSDITGTGNATLNSATNNAITQGAIAAVRGQDLEGVLNAAGTGAATAGLNTTLQNNFELPPELTRPISNAVVNASQGQPVNYGSLIQGIINYANSSNQEPRTQQLTSDLAYDIFPEIPQVPGIVPDNLQYSNPNIPEPAPSSEYEYGDELPADDYEFDFPAPPPPLSEEDAFQQYMEQYNFPSVPITGNLPSPPPPAYNLLDDYYLGMGGVEGSVPETQQVIVTGNLPSAPPPPAPTPDYIDYYYGMDGYGGGTPGTQQAIVTGNLSSAPPPPPLSEEDAFQQYMEQYNFPSVPITGNLPSPPLSEEDAFQQYMEQYGTPSVPIVGSRQPPAPPPPRPDFFSLDGWQSFPEQIEIVGNRPLRPPPPRPDFFSLDGWQSFPEQIEIVGNRPLRPPVPTPETNPQMPAFNYEPPPVPSYTPINPAPTPAPSPRPSLPTPSPTPAKSGLDMSGLFGILGAMGQPQTQLQDIIYRGPNGLVIPGSNVKPGSLPYAYDGGLVDYLNRKG